MPSVMWRESNKPKAHDDLHSFFETLDFIHGNLLDSEAGVKQMIIENIKNVVDIDCNPNVSS